MTSTHPQKPRWRAVSVVCRFVDLCWKTGPDGVRHITHSSLYGCEFGKHWKYVIGVYMWRENRLFQHLFQTNTFCYFVVVLVPPRIKVFWLLFWYIWLQEVSVTVGVQCRSSPLLLKSFCQTFVGNCLVCCKSAPNEVQDGHKQTVLQGLAIERWKIVEIFPKKYKD